MIDGLYPFIIGFLYQRHNLGNLPRTELGIVEYGVIHGGHDIPERPVKVVPVLEKLAGQAGYRRIVLGSGLYVGYCGAGVPVTE